MVHDASEQEWLARFHSGEREILEECYREHFRSVSSAVGRILRGADQETVIHEVFFRMIESKDFRAQFKGGSIRAWLSVVARNQSLDFARRRKREIPVDVELESMALEPDRRDPQGEIEGRLLLERFQQECVPDKWRAVFEACYLLRLSQREAAARLGIHRTTLAYQERRLRGRLLRFLKRSEEP